MTLELLPAPEAARLEPAVRTVDVALAGCGVVGGELARRFRGSEAELAARHGVRFRLVAVLVRDAGRPRPAALAPGVLTTDVEAFLAAPADVVVEAIGGTDVALRIARQVLASGRRLVTANKALLARHGRELAALAHARGARLDFEAAVGGGIPVLRALRDQLAGAEVRHVRGVLNGTTGYILTRLEEGAGYAAALREAQRMGYAEADPRRDVGGMDAADKIRVLAWLAFGADPAGLPVRTRGLAPHADRLAADAAALGGVLRVVAEASRGPAGVTAVVEPRVVDPGGEFGRVRGVDNLVTVETAWNGVVRLGGPGAGGEPTASALLGDLVRGAAALPAAAEAVPGVPEDDPHDWVVSARPGAERLLLETLERAGAAARRVVWAPDAVRAVVAGVRWRRIALATRALEAAGAEPAVSRLEIGST